MIWLNVPTGGRAVLHQGDLTYAVITSQFSGDRLQVYQQICEFLIQGCLRLGLELHYGSEQRNYIHNPNCFGTATGADLVLGNGSKLIGSAQLKHGQAILQHGSLRLEPDAELFHQVFGETEIPLKLPLSLSGDALFTTVIDTLILAAADCFKIELIPQPLSEQEWEQIRQFTPKI